MTLLALLAVTLAVIGALLLPPVWARRRRARLRATPMAPHLRAIIDRDVPLAARLPRHLRQRLEQDVQVFLAEKDFIGCQGFEVDDRARVVIAAQASLLTLQRPDAYERLRTILVYPSAFVVERIRPEPSGVLQERRQVLTGESWVQGQVVLSWDDVLEGARDPADGQNVVLHEFAHQLDQAKGYANGAPWVGGREARDRWSRVFAQAYAELQWRAANGLPSVLSDYGATAPAEFFAVATEVFYERPEALASHHPDLYAELRAFFRVDPLAW